MTNHRSYLNAWRQYNVFIITDHTTIIAVYIYRCSVMMFIICVICVLMLIMYWEIIGKLLGNQCKIVGIWLENCWEFVWTTLIITACLVNLSQWPIDYLSFNHLQFKCQESFSYLFYRLLSFQRFKHDLWHFSYKSPSVCTYTICHTDNNTPISVQFICNTGFQVPH